MLRPGSAIVAIFVLLGCQRVDRAPAVKDSVPATSDSGATSKDVVVPSGPAAESDGCGDRTIREASVGKIAIGDPVSAVRRCHVVRDTVVAAGEGSRIRTLFVALAADTVAAEIVDGRVWRIAVSSPGIRTVDSLGVGTSLRRLLQVSEPRGASGEGRMFVLSPNHCGQSFEISHFGPMPRGGWTRAALAKLPETTHVIGVLVNSCHPELY